MKNNEIAYLDLGFIPKLSHVHANIPNTPHFEMQTLWFQALGMSETQSVCYLKEARVAGFSDT